MTPRVTSRLTMLILAGLLMACESESTLPDKNKPGPTGELVIDASSNTDFTWITLAGPATVNVGNPAGSTAWDFGIRRYEVRLNGGLSGPGEVGAVVLVNHAGQDAATILGYTPGNRLAEFDAVDADDIPAASSFKASILVEDATSWFKPAGQTVVANPASVWKVRRADGGYALIRVSELALGQQGLSSISIEYRLQSAGGSLGAAQSVVVTPGMPGNPARISLADGSVTSAAGCTWDLAVDGGFGLKLNNGAGCNTGSFPLREGESFGDVTTAADAPDYGPFLAAISSPIANSVAAADAPPFLYGLDPANPHRLIPSFNIYLVRRGDAVWKMQFTSYYNPVGGASGYPTVRVSRIK